MRSASVAASSRSWVTSTIGIVSRWRIWASSRCRRRRVIWSTAENGSSSSSTFGSRASARARATRCCWPPESWRGRRDLEARRGARTRASSRATRRRASAPQRAGSAPRRSASRSCAGTARSSGTRGRPAAPAAARTPRAGRATSRRSTRTLARRGRDQARDRPQDGGLAAARRTDERERARPARTSKRASQGDRRALRESTREAGISHGDAAASVEP